MATFQWFPWVPHRQIKKGKEEKKKIFLNDAKGSYWIFLSFQSDLCVWRAKCYSATGAGLLLFSLEGNQSPQGSKIPPENSRGRLRISLPPTGCRIQVGREQWVTECLKRPSFEGITDSSAGLNCLCNINPGKNPHGLFLSPTTRQTRNAGIRTVNCC